MRLGAVGIAAAVLLFVVWSAQVNHTATIADATPAEPSWSGTLPEAARPMPCEYVATVEGDALLLDCTVGGAVVSRTVLAIPALPAPVVSPVIPWAPPWRGESIVVTVTQYYCEYNGGFYGDGGGYCGGMRWGLPVYDGAAACGGYWPAKAVLYVEGWGEVVCEDTGHLGWTQVDIFVYYSADLRMSHMMVPWTVTRVR